MQPTKIIAFAIGAVIIGLFVWGYSQSGQGNNSAVVRGGVGSSSAKSGLTAAETFYDFGLISMKNGEVTKEFTITNTTDKTVLLKTVLTSCMCTKAFIVNPAGNLKGPFGMAGMGYIPPANEIINPGENRIIRVVFDPNAHGPAGVGVVDRLVTLTEDSGGTLQFEIKASVAP